MDLDRYGGEVTLGEGKGSGPHLRTGGRPAGNELGLRCLLAARILSQAQSPV
jgi:hypothetical protein